MIKIVKDVLIAIIAFVLAGLAAVLAVKMFNEEKWEKFAKMQHCKQISGDEFQCDMGQVKRWQGD